MKGQKHPRLAPTKEAETEERSRGGFADKLKSPRLSVGIFHKILLSARNSAPLKRKLRAESGERVKTADTAVAAEILLGEEKYVAAAAKVEDKGNVYAFARLNLRPCV